MCCLFSAKWEIVSFSGFTLDEGKLYDFNLPVMRNY